MTIEIQKIDKPTHSENLFYDARCLSCPRISMESGDELPGSFEIAGIEEDLSLEEVVARSKKHQARDGSSHEIIIREFDSGLIEDALGY